ncbi:MAG: hypothetical protein GKR91_05870 [Pseudomonadales bacterium]|nr:hypothetical protein [Pseudomonadales bacterium]
MELRSETRVEQDAIIFVHVKSCIEKPELVGTSIQCIAKDFSRSGLKHNTELSLSPGSLVYISLSIENPFSSFLLLGEVRWDYEEDGKLMNGIKFLEGQYSELKRWVEAFDSIFEDETVGQSNLILDEKDESE